MAKFGYDPKKIKNCQKNVSDFENRSQKGPRQDLSMFDASTLLRAVIFPEIWFVNTSEKQFAVLQHFPEQ